MRTGFSVATLFLMLAAVGCGGGGGHAVTSYVLVSNVPENVIADANTCTDIEGPYPIPRASTMSFVIDDSPNQGYDHTEIGIIDDAILTASGCDFTQATAHFSGPGSYTSTSPAGIVPPGNYDFIVSCQNAVGNCIFNLTWTASY